MQVGRELALSEVKEQANDMQRSDKYKAVRSDPASSYHRDGMTTLFKHLGAARSCAHSPDLTPFERGGISQAYKDSQTIRSYSGLLVPAALTSLL
ncbi:hypothetical protein KCU95_g60, partial [Aureobasidium melanogenum]